MNAKPTKKTARKPLHLVSRETLLTTHLNDAERVLWRFSDSVRRGISPSAADMRALATKLDRILNGGDPAKALGLSKRKAGRPGKAQEHIEIAIDVASRVEKRGDLDKALAAVALARNKPVNTIRTIYYSNLAEATSTVETAREFARDQHEFGKAYKELEHAFGRADRDRIFGELSARFAVAFARRLRGANVSEYHDLMEEIRRIFPTK